MEDLNSRFPHVSEQIFDYLENKELANCKLVCKSWSSSMESMRYYWLRVIDSTTELTNCPLPVKKLWFKIMKEVSLDSAKILAKMYENHRQTWSPVAFGKTPLVPLHLAAESPDFEFFMDVYSVSEEKCLIDVNEMSPMLHAAKFGRLENFKIFVECLHDKNPRSYMKGITPLHLAAEFGHYDLVAYILPFTTNKNPHDSTGKTPLNLATNNGHVKVCNEIVMEINTGDRNPPDGRGNTPLHLACISGKKALFDLFFDVSKDKSVQNLQAETPLHFAAKYGRLDICKKLLDFMDNKNPKTINDFTPLHGAALKGHYEVMDTLLRVSDEKNPKCFTNGKTPLHFAAENGDVRICRLILDTDVPDKNPEDKSGITPFCEVVLKGHVELCKLFIEKCPHDVLNLKTKQLNVATQLGHLEIAWLILQAVRGVKIESTIDYWNDKAKKEAYEYLKQKIREMPEGQENNDRCLLTILLEHFANFAVTCVHEIDDYIYRKCNKQLK